jgi:hypothetical protein
MIQFKEPECALGQPIKVVSASWWHVLEFSLLRQKFSSTNSANAGIKAASHNSSSVRRADMGSG